MFFAVPIMHGLASFKDIRELELIDFVMMNEILLVKSENEYRQNQQANQE